MSHWVALFLAIASSIGANIAVKRAVDGVQLEASWEGVKAVILEPWLWIALSFCGLLFFSYLYAIRGVPLSTAYPVVTSSAMIGVATAGSILFGEAVGLRGMVGIGFVLVGLTLLATK
jgi:multidrug transporter EmrE-like cation transporter